jgi:hypothetical protein
MGEFSLAHLNRVGQILRCFIGFCWGLSTGFAGFKSGDKGKEKERDS